jgi:hypothetical protein
MPTETTGHWPPCILIHVVVLMVCLQLPCGRVNGMTIASHVVGTKLVVIPDYSCYVENRLSGCYVFHKLFSPGQPRWKSDYTVDIRSQRRNAEFLIYPFVLQGSHNGINIGVWVSPKGIVSYPEIECRRSSSVRELDYALNWLAYINWFRCAFLEGNPSTRIHLIGFSHLVQLAVHDGQLPASKTRIEERAYGHQNRGATRPLLVGTILRSRVLGWLLFSIGGCGGCLGLYLLITLNNWRHRCRRVLGLVLLSLVSWFMTHIGTGILIGYW